MLTTYVRSVQQCHVCIIECFHFFGPFPVYRIQICRYLLLNVIYLTDF